MLMSDAAAAVPIFDGHKDILSRLNRAGGPDAIAGFLACFARFVPDMPAGLMLVLLVLPALAWTHFILLQLKRPRDL